MAEGALVYRHAFLDGLRPDPELTVSEWADAHRMLSSKASAEPGPWRTDRTPYLREPMDCLSSTSPIQRVVLMFGAQLGKTEAGSNWLGYIIHHTPGPALLIQPTVDMAKRLSKQRLESMLSETPVLAERIAPSRSRDSGNTMFAKEFPGGIMILTGANSATGLRSAPCRFVFADEVDAYPQDVGGEGDPLTLAERRTSTFARRKILITSTPTLKDFSRVEREYLRSDQRRFYIPCPHCDHYQYLRWGQMKWEKGQPETVKYECENCGERFEERYKTQFLNRGEWRATAESQSSVTAGYQLSSLYSPLGWRSWPEICDDFLRAKTDPAILKTWVNTTLGETFEDEYAAKLSAEGLMARREDYASGLVPNGALILTAGVDVQGGGGAMNERLVVSVWGWGEGEEAWLVWHGDILGDPTQSEVWQKLESVLQSTWTREDGREMIISLMAIDSGGADGVTHEVYMFARDHRAMGAIAVKGSSSTGKGQPAVSRGNHVDINWRGQTIRRGCILYMIGGDTIKTTLYGRLRHNERGPGSFHFGLAADEQFFRELTAEKVQIKSSPSGFPKRVWVKDSSQRNEALDCLVYAYAGLQLMYRRLPRVNMWQQLRDQLGKPPRLPDSQTRSSRKKEKKESWLSR